MGVAIETNQQSSKMIRLVAGKLVLEESQRNIYVVPPKGEYDWSITGYSLPFKMKKSPQFIKEGESEFAEKTRVEFTIDGGPGNGRMFTILYGWALGSRAVLGKLCRALGVDLSVTPFDMDQIIGYRGHSYVGHALDMSGAVKLNEQGKPAYAEIAIDDRFVALGPPATPYFIDLSGMDTGASTNGNGHTDEPTNDTTNDVDEWPAA
jgi:hypothetical protein